jgi:hypothetical protein
MTILSEFALTPEVFDVTSYSNNGAMCDLYLQKIKDVLIQDGLVRNLRNGEWSQLFAGNNRPWHQRGKELLKKLIKQNRLIDRISEESVDPISETDWCDEALRSHENIRLDGIIVTNSIADKYKKQNIVSSIERLSSAEWWSNRSPSLRLNRTIDEYITNLNLILKHANSIMFIDPHIDPDKYHYNDFIRLLETSGHRDPVPLIELHRVCYRGSGRSREILNLDDIEILFREKYSKALQSSGISVHVFIWDDFHDRCLISNLVGINMPNGFDTDRTPKAKTTWSRIGRKDCDDIQREFDPASHRHKLKKKFIIP